VWIIGTFVQSPSFLEHGPGQGQLTRNLARLPGHTENPQFSGMLAELGGLEKGSSLAEWLEQVVQFVRMLPKHLR